MSLFIAPVILASAVSLSSHVCLCFVLLFALFAAQWITTTWPSFDSFLLLVTFVLFPSLQTNFIWSCRCSFELGENLMLQSRARWCRRILLLHLWCAVKIFVVWSVFIVTPVKLISRGNLQLHKQPSLILLPLSVWALKQSVLPHTFYIHPESDGYHLYVL